MHHTYIYSEEVLALHFKVPMKRNFVQLFIDCLAKIPEDDSVTSLAKFSQLSFFSSYLTLFDMQIIQLMTSLYVMSIFEIANSVAYGSKKHLKVCCTCVNSE